MYQHWDRISVICELLAVKQHGYLELHLFSSLLLNVFIQFYVLHIFSYFSYFLKFNFILFIIIIIFYVCLVCVTLYDIRNK